MTDVTQILSGIESGDSNAAEQLRLVDEDLASIYWNIEKVGAQSGQP